MKSLSDYLSLLENRLAIESTLTLSEDKIVPNTKVLTKKFIKEKMIDDLFQYHNGKVVFTNRFLSFVSDITDRQVLAGHYSLELRKV